MSFIKTLGIQVLTAVAGANGKETALGGVLAIGTTAVAYLGGWGIALKFLLFAMVFDYVTGFLAALKVKKVDSDVMFWGGVRKGIVLGVIVFAGFTDAYLIETGNLEKPVIQSGAYYFYLVREGISIAENLGKLNVLVPDIVKDRLAQLKGKGGNNGS